MLVKNPSDSTKILSKYLFKTHIVLLKKVLVAMATQSDIKIQNIIGRCKLSYLALAL